MPRQPLLPVYKHLTHRFTANSLFLRPQFATVIGQCIVLWTQVEVQMGYVLSAIMGANTEASVALFMSIRNSKAQRDALNAAAEAVLAGDNLDLFAAILNFYRSIETQRNDLAHGLFGHCDETDEIVTWIDPKHQTQSVVKFFAVVARTKDLDELATVLTGIETNKLIYVYKIKDLQSLYNETEQLYLAVFNFAAYLRDPETPLTVELHRQIFELPQIQRELETIREGRKSESEAPH